MRMEKWAILTVNDFGFWPFSPQLIKDLPPKTGEFEVGILFPKNEIASGLEMN